MKTKYYVSPAKADRNNIIKRRLIHLFKWLVYVLILFFSFAFMMTPGAGYLGGIVPLFIIPLVVSITVWEGETAGGGFAILAGLVWASGSNTFWGFDTIILYFCAVVVGLSIRFFLKDNFVNTLLLVAFTAGVYLLASFFIQYGMWNYAGGAMVLKNTYIPIFFLTVAVTPPYYFLVKGIFYGVRSRAGAEFWPR